MRVHAMGRVMRLQGGLSQAVLGSMIVLVLLQVASGEHVTFHGHLSVNSVGFSVCQHQKYASKKVLL